MTEDNSLKFPSFWRLQAIGWTCLYLLALAGSIPDFLKGTGGVRGNTLAIVFMLCGSLVLHPVCRSLVRRSLPWLAFEFRAFVWSLVVGTAAAIATEFVVLNFRRIDWPDLAGNSVQFAVVLFLWCSLYFSIKQWQQAAREREKLLRAESEAREARLSALRYQLNPHFLFNSLNAVSTLVLEGNAAAATRMLAQIGELLRTTLDGESLLEIPLAHELAFIKQYLAIEQTRLGDRLRVETTISQDTLDAAVPNMLLQPLVENAVRHGIAALIEGGTITLTSALHDDNLLITIANSGPGVEGTALQNGTHSSGIGLTNTAERLRTLYGENQRFVLQPLDAGGYEATIEIPFRKVPSVAEEAVCAS
jgi:two-component system, LytTR family, sensor kinase